MEARDLQSIGFAVRPTNIRTSVAEAMLLLAFRIADKQSDRGDNLRWACGNILRGFDLPQRSTGTARFTASRFYSIAR